MRRRHLFEQAWFPAVWRDLLTDVLSFVASRYRPYDVVADRLAAAIRRTAAQRVVDLCSGGGAPILTVLDTIRDRTGLEVPVILTDKHPNIAAFRRAAAHAPDRVQVIESQVDVTRVPAELRGFRTLFTAFHHFAEGSARSILADAVGQRHGIGVFDYTERNLLLWGLPILGTPLFVFLVTPRIRPMAWRRLLWTYLVPVLPMVAAWDCLVSCLRTYTPDELLTLARDVSTDYSWEAGRLRCFGGCHVTFLIGCPPEGDRYDP